MTPSVPFGAEEQPVRRRAGARPGQPPRLAHPGRRDDAQRLRQVVDVGVAAWRSGRRRGWPASRRARRTRTTAGSAAASGRAAAAGPRGAGRARRPGSAPPGYCGRPRAPGPAGRGRALTAGPSKRGSTPPTTELPPPYGIDRDRRPRAPVEHVDDVLLLDAAARPGRGRAQVAVQVADDVAERLAVRVRRAVGRRRRAERRQRRRRHDPRPEAGRASHASGGAWSQGSAPGQQRGRPRRPAPSRSAPPTASSTVPHPHHDRVLLTGRRPRVDWRRRSGLAGWSR